MSWLVPDRAGVARVILTASVLLLAGRPALAADVAYTPVDYPSPGSVTDIRGFSGGRAVGHYFLASGDNHGFLYDGSTFTDLDYPPGPGVGQTFPTGIEGDSVVGYYFTGPRGFRHDTATAAFAPLTHPSGDNLQPEGTDGTRVVGYRLSPGFVANGFLFDGATWTDLNYPGSGFTNVTGIDGQTIVGYYSAGGTNHGFTHVLGSPTWTTLDFPGAVSTQVWDIDGGRIVGQYATDTRLFGFVLEGGTWTSINIPGSITAWVTAVDGNRIAGNYFIDPVRQQGFIATIPEPSLALLSCAALAACRFRRR